MRWPDFIMLFKLSGFWAKQITMWTGRYTISQRSEYVWLLSMHFRSLTHDIVCSVCDASWDTEWPYSLFSHMTDGASSCLGGLDGRRWKSIMSSKCHVFSLLLHSSFSLLGLLKLSISQARSTFLSLSFSSFHDMSPHGLWCPYFIAA